MLHPLLSPGPTRIVGIVNVTPDSFSDGGRWYDHRAALAHGLALVADGAQVIDVGGESTRPGADRVDESEELRRVRAVVRDLAGAGAVVSIDTTRATVAATAVSEGAQLVNDVSGGLADPDMLPTIAELGVPWICMHSRGASRTMDQRAVYDDVVTRVRDDLQDRITAAAAAGIAPGRTIVDPGLGFAKTADHNWELLRRIDELASLGCPILVGASRKRFLGALLADESGPRPPGERDAATAALTALLASQRIWGVRTHTAADQRDAIAVAERLRPTK